MTGAPTVIVAVAFGIFALILNKRLKLMHNLDVVFWAFLLLFGWWLVWLRFLELPYSQWIGGSH